MDKHTSKIINELDRKDIGYLIRKVRIMSNEIEFELNEGTFEPLFEAVRRRALVLAIIDGKTENEKRKYLEEASQRYEQASIEDKALADYIKREIEYFGHCFMNRSQNRRRLYK